MDPKVLAFLKKDRISVLTTILPDGTPHSASIHFANSTDASSFVFWTARDSRKCAHFEEGVSYPASLVVGFDEAEFVTVQMEGQVSLVSKSELDKMYEVYKRKFGGSDKYEGDSKDALLKFQPKWWRYTEFKPKFFKIESN